jgi:choice-of-anchor A domain-containing protein/uncharacterized repeat protein (TIGR01451 family)
MQASSAARPGRVGDRPAAPPKAASLPHRPRLRRLALSGALVCAVPGLALVGAQPAAAAEPAPVACAVHDGKPLGAATGWTEFVRGNGQRGSESEGSIAYGGDLNASGMTVGTRLTAGKDDPTLVVAGTAHSFNLQRGSAYVRNLTGYINFNGGGKRLASAPIDVAGAFPGLRELSALWAQAPANGSASVVESGTNDTVALGGPVLLLRGTDPKRNTFSVTPQQLTGIRATLIDVPAGATVLINVSGTSVQVGGEVRFRSGGTYHQPDNAPVRDAVQRTIWNFSAATTVKLNTGSAFGGTVFAPDAAVTAVSIGHSNGQTVAASFASNYETHQYLVASDACLPGGTPPDPDPEPEPEPDPEPAELHVAKTVDRPAVVGGEQATFTLTVTNRGAGPAADVVLSDLLPAGTTFAFADPGCTAVGPVVRCVAGTLATGQSASFRVTVTTAPLLGVAGGGNDQLSAVSVEHYLTLDADEVQTATIGCAAGGVLTDSSVEILHVDQGTGTLEDVEVLRLHTRDGAYEAVVANHASGAAQARVYGVCLPARTTDGHAILAGDPVEKTVTLGVGRHDATFRCGAGRTPIAPSLNVPRGRATVVASVPVGDSGRRVTLDVRDPDTEVTVGVRCLSALTGPAGGTTTALRWNVISAPITVGPGQTVTQALICGDRQKGIVAGWELEGGLTPLGHAPQPKSRVFRFHNPTGTAKSGTIYLLCVDERTADPQGTTTVTNTVTGTTTSPQTGGAVLSAGTDLTIQGATPPSEPPDVDITPRIETPAPLAITPSVPAPSPARAAAATPTSAKLRSSTVAVGVRCRTARCTGTVEVRADRRLRVGGQTVKARGLLAKRSFRVRKGRTGTVRVALPKRVVTALRRQGVKTVRISVRDRSGVTTKTLRLRR